MSGVMGASFRSIAGSPAWTAIVSACDIASAYLTPLVATQLEPIAEAFQNGQATVEFGVATGPQRRLTSDPRGIRHGAERVKDPQRSGQQVAVARDHPESTSSLRLERPKHPVFRHLQELAQLMGGRWLPGVDQQIRASLAALRQTAPRAGHLNDRRPEGAQVA